MPGPEPVLVHCTCSHLALQPHCGEGAVIPALWRRRLGLERLHHTQGHTAQKWQGQDSGADPPDHRAAHFPSTWRLTLTENEPKWLKACSGSCTGLLNSRGRSRPLAPNSGLSLHPRSSCHHKLVVTDGLPGTDSHMAMGIGERV